MNLSPRPATGLAGTAAQPDEQLMQLLDRVARHDATALRALYDATRAKLYGLALRVLRRHDWAEDTLQEAFLQVWRTAADYRSSLSPPMAWLGLIVRSRALDQLRRRKVEGEHLHQELDEVLADTLPGDAASPLDSSQASQQASALHQCLERLDHRQRQALSLAYLRELSHSELASHLGEPLGTVKSWIRRGLDQLRTCMARYA